MRMRGHSFFEAVSWPFGLILKSYLALPLHKYRKSDRPRLLVACPRMHARVALRRESNANTGGGRSALRRCVQRAQRHCLLKNEYWRCAIDVRSVETNRRTADTYLAALHLRGRKTQLMALATVDCRRDGLHFLL